MLLLLQTLFAATVLCITVRGAELRATDKIVVIAATAPSSPLLLPDLLLHGVHVTECAAEGEHVAIVHTHT
jgi:ornithine cyclodeaminase/alanine dehydrogenase-like protein (mu-crystallin family)